MNAIKPNIPILKLLLCFVLFSGIQASAQPPNIDSLKTWQLKSYGKKAAKAGDTYGAIAYFEKYAEVKPGNLGVTYRLAQLHYQARNYPKAGELYQELYDTDPEKYTKALFFSAQIQKMNGEYESALKKFEEFKKAYKGAKDAKTYRKLVKNEIEGCEIAKSIMDSTLDVIITHLDTSINKPHIEFNPIAITDTTMVYASLKVDSLTYYSTADSVKKPTRTFYTAKKTDEKKNLWEAVGTWQKQFNSDSVNVGNGAFSPDGKHFYFTKCQKNWRGNVICAIYKTEIIDGEWQEPYKLNEEINMPKYTSTQPTVGYNAKKGREVLYFVTDRPGGKGGTDIWYTEYYPRREKWKSPRKAGSKINTVGDEITPFYDQETGTMYFSSNGLPGLGGFDIFKTTGEKSRYEEPTNIGHPVNSGYDDLYFTLTPSQETGFFTSNRAESYDLKNQYCCDDLYAFKWTQYLHIAVDGKLFEVPEDSTAADSIAALPDSLKKGLEGAEIDLYLINKDGDEIFIREVESDSTGNYLQKLEQGKDYKLVIGKDGYLSRSLSISTKHITSSDTINMKPVGVQKIPEQPIVMSNIYFDYGKATLSSASKDSLEASLLSILQENPLLIIEIGAHTDNKGSDSYNQRLSQRRAESVVNFLVSKGIDKDRLKAKGYGEAHPIAPNTHEDGSDNPEGRAKNRRTEFKILGKLDPAVLEDKEFEKE